MLRRATAATSFLASFTQVAVAGTYAFHSLDIPNATTAAGAITVRGSVAGSASFADTGSVQGAIFTAGGYVTFTNREATNTTVAVGINGRLEVLAAYVDTHKKNRAATRNYRDGKLTAIGVPQSYSTTPIAINDKGIAVGNFLRKSGETQAFVWSAANGASVVLPPGVRRSTAAAINDAGTIVGTYTDAHRIVHGYSYAGNTYTTIDLPGSTATNPTAISPDGVVSGDAVINGIDTGFTLLGEAYTMFTVPGAVAVRLVSGSADGYLIGDFTDAAGSVHAFVRSASKYFTLSFPAATATTIVAATQDGNIAGNYLDAAGKSHAFLGVCAAAQRPCTQ